MKARSALSIKWLLSISLIISLLSGCGMSSTISESYPLESVNKDGNATSYVYRAAGQTVPEVAKALEDQRSPKQISAEDPERMFLVYSNEWYHLQRDPDKPEDTLIEVDSEEYVRNNYDNSFLQGYITASIIGSLFDSLDGGGKYRGYSSKDVYQPKQGTYKQATDVDKKITAPLTVNKKGSLIRRGTDSSDSVGSGGSIFSRQSGDSSSKDKSRGSISKSKDSSSSWFDSPKKSITTPKKKSGFGKIKRRGRR
ncbi:protein of unknown function [Fontibacillus panacisegetis]|uniref:DUF4247 domain-containing protein n=1 Tax=Fontibacillus panacisegetis TaxID=670482 RepID=A0A1G7KUE3_9BACL|nr:DUF4247 domain-containing protein [Fontibacillus panacisegetis]SDF40862.1 protein of unknown function [Fontibacillus panacisegetis]